MDTDRSTLRELAGLFLRLGVTSFGGPAAHVAMMRDEVVLRRQWLDNAAFLDLYAAANLIPGPNSTELAIHIGWRRRRFAGLLVAGLAFILPAVLLTGMLAWMYVRWGTLPRVEGILWGIKPVIVAIVAHAVIGLAPTAGRSWPLRVIGVLALVATILGANELAVIFGGGLVACAMSASTRSSVCLLAPLVPVAATAGSSAVTLPSVFWVFAKIGSVLFGSGYVLIAFLRSDLVERLGWLSERQLLDAVVVGQVTPGPVFSTATFVGWVVAGPGGAIAATLGIFLPAFVFCAISGPFIPRLRASKPLGAFLDGVVVASLGLMAVVAFDISRAVLVDPASVGVAVIAFVLLARVRVNATWLVAGGALVGLVRVFGGSSGP